MSLGGQMSIILKFVRSSGFVFRRTYCVSGNVRVRFAPSPTGNLHLGGLRTALLNYLFAKKNGGSFILRIEDTDRKRIVPGSAESIQSALQWVGINPDEGPSTGGKYGPYVQSKRVGRYKQKAEELLQVGAAYKCFCSETRLELLRKEAMVNRRNPGYDNKCRHLSEQEIKEYTEEGRPYTIRFKIKDGPVSFKDLVFGEHAFDTSGTEGDFIILKSDGFPTYHFSCVVDDHAMEISHVLRGAEWLTSTAKHLMLHQAFGWDAPTFAHLPLLVNSDHTKLSKRQLALSVDHFKEKGYEPLALVNFLAGIGTGLHEGCQVFELEELVHNFDISRVNTTSCVLDLKKLDVYNNLYLTKQLTSEISTGSLVEQFKAVLIQKLSKQYELNDQHLSNSYIERILHCYKGRITMLSELLEPDMLYLWTFPEKEVVRNQLQKLGIAEKFAFDILQKVEKSLSKLPDNRFETDNMSAVLRSCIGEEKEVYVAAMKMLRVVLTGQKNGPSVAEIFSMLGPERSLTKLKMATKSMDEIINEQNHDSHYAKKQ